MRFNYYCLSLEKFRKVRFIRTKKDYFDKNSIPITEVFGIDGSKYKSSIEIAKLYNLKLGNKLKKSSPILTAIAQSHRNIWKKIMNDTSDYTIIFEDDIIINNNNFKNDLDIIIKEYNKLKSPKILLLGYLYIDDNNHHNMISKINQFTGLQCYMLDKTTAKYLYGNTKYLYDQIDIVISDTMINKYVMKNKLVSQKNISSIAHNQRYIFLENINQHFFSTKIGINFNLNIGTTYHINLTYNTIFNIIMGLIGRLYIEPDIMIVIYYHLLLILEIFIYGGVIFIDCCQGLNNISRYDDDEVINKWFDIILFSIIFLF